MGEVYRASHPKATRDVAIKVLSRASSHRTRCPSQGSSVKAGCSPAQRSRIAILYGWQWSSWKGRLSRDEVREETMR